MNNTPKYIVSKTLEEPLEWNNSTLIKENVAEEITKLKQQPGKDISITGNPTLVRSLLQGGLFDELRLMVHPIVVGSGKRLFAEGGDQKALKLVDSRTFSTGVLYLTYQAEDGCREVDRPPKRSCPRNRSRRPKAGAGLAMGAKKRMSGSRANSRLPRRDSC
jgi:hypothetical protein